MATRLHQFINSLFTADFKTQPYWWGRNSRQPLVSAAALPARVEVAVVRSGDTGLNAALQIARGGRTTLVLDAEAAGWAAAAALAARSAPAPSRSSMPWRAATAGPDTFSEHHPGVHPSLETPSRS